jgi:hypothetical protein
MTDFVNLPAESSITFDFRVKQFYHVWIYRRLTCIGRINLGRKAALFGFWIVGFGLGAFAWMVKTPVINLVQSIGLSSDASQALIAGLFGSVVMVLSVLVWSFLSSSS